MRRLPFLLADTIAPKEQCSGALESVKPIADAIQRGARVSGWAWDAILNRPASRIVIVTPDGVISGLARGDGYGLQRETSIPHPPETIWRGFLRAMPQPLPVSAYAIIDNDSKACLLDVGGSVSAEFAGTNTASTQTPLVSTHR
jgi:hypothetical protein